MSVIDQLQEGWVQDYLSLSSGRGILNLCPRSGKTRVALKIVNKLSPVSVLVCMPRLDILKSWSDELDLGAQLIGTTFEFTTFASLPKHFEEDYDLIIIDEAHEMSDNQMLNMSVICAVFDKPVLALTGTITKKTEDNLYGMLGLEVCARFSIEDGVAAGILPDYEIIIHQVSLDKFILDTKNRSEKKRFQGLQFVYNQGDKNTKRFMYLKMIALLQSSVAKLNKTRELIKFYEADRLLIFCGLTVIADSLGIPVYHSKSKEKQIFMDFCNGIGDKLATIKLMQAGITVKPIKRGILNYISGAPEDSAQKICRFLGYEYDNPDKKAEIHIISSTETFELNRIKTALSFFNPDKIKYI